jgi:pimeloyl-ACP methyl ester carboxylesterase
MPIAGVGQARGDIIRHGKGTPHMVMLHASATGPSTLGRLAGLLSGDEYSVLIPALNGYGSGRPSPGADPVAANTAIAGDCLDRLSSRPRLLFGHSMGGLVALLAALEQQARGRPLDALVLYDPVLVGLLDRDDPDDRDALAWDHAVIAELATCVADGRPDAGMRRFVEAWNEMAWNDLPEQAREGLVAMADTVAREARATSEFRLDEAVLRGMRTSVILITGGGSPAMIGRIASKATGLLPSVHHEIITDAGHMAPVLAPAKLAAATAPLLRPYLGQR